jgi:hypothetical protein
MSELAGTRREKVVLLAPPDPVGVRWPEAHSEGGGISAEQAERVAQIRAGRCKPSPRRLWRGYHCEKDKELRRSYGFGCELYWQVFVLQGEVCGVCEEPPGKTLLIVDEDEDTREIRGLLHPRCNGRITAGVARYLADPPALRLGRFVVSAERFARRQRRLAAKRRARRNRAKTVLKEVPQQKPNSYAAKLAAARQPHRR